MTPEQALLESIKAEIQTRHGNMMFLVGQLPEESRELMVQSVEASTTLLKTLVDTFLPVKQPTAESESLPTADYSPFFIRAWRRLSNNEESEI